MKLTRLLAIAAIGAGIGILLYTKPGKKLRNDIADASGDLMKKLTDLSKKTAENLKTIGKDTRKMASEYTS